MHDKTASMTHHKQQGCVYAAERAASGAPHTAALRAARVLPQKLGWQVLQVVLLKLECIHEGLQHSRSS